MATIEMTLGEAKDFVIVIANEDGERFNLTGYDELKVCLPAAGGGNLELTEVATVEGSVVTINGLAVLGELLVDIKPTDAETLNVGKYQAIYVEINQSADPTLRKRFNLQKALTVAGFDC